jgi:hypothetical protein
MLTRSRNITKSKQTQSQLKSRNNYDAGRLGMGDIWESGRNNNKNMWIRISKRCVDIERQNMEVMMRDKNSLTL